MNPKDRRTLERAIKNREVVTIAYAKPSGKGQKGGKRQAVQVVTRHVRPYELSVNKSGRPVLWGSDNIHGARQIHAFRNDRIVGVQESQRPQTFKPAKSIAKHLESYPDIQPTPKRRPRR